ncbi:sure-like protein [Amylocystis lapponica]|nr:sure-like protein [Amylocystis lapponica]
MSMFRNIVFVLCLVSAVRPYNIVLTNDDGWATASIRGQYAALTNAGYNGYNASDTRLNYVNSYPVDAVRYGIQTLAPQFFSGSPDFVVSGPNIGSTNLFPSLLSFSRLTSALQPDNLGTGIDGSGTVGAACEAAKEGIPSTAFSGDSGSQVSYTTLASSPDSSSSVAARVYGALTAHFAGVLLAGGAPVLPSGVTLNVNYPAVDSCGAAADYSWVFSRLVQDASAVDVETCGSTVLPYEEEVVGTSGCYASVTVINATSKTDVDAATQSAVLGRLGNLPLSCLSS